MTPKEIAAHPAAAMLHGVDPFSPVTDPEVRLAINRSDEPRNRVAA
jgi:hypothetical protein